MQGVLNADFVEQLLAAADSVWSVMTADCHTLIEVVMVVSVYSATNEIMQCFSAFTVLGTCVYGGALLATAMDYFVEQLQMVRWLWDRVTLRHSGQPCWFSWLILSIWPGMLVFGFIIQFTITGRGIYHQKRKRNPLCLSITIIIE